MMSLIERYWAKTPSEAYQIALMKDQGLVMQR